MLVAHLDPNRDVARRKYKTINEYINWMMRKLDLEKGKAVLDLGR